MVQSIVWRLAMGSNDQKQVNFFNNSIVNQGTVSNTQQTISGTNVITKNGGNEELDTFINTLIENKQELLHILNSIDKKVEVMSDDLRDINVEMTRALVSITDSDSKNGYESLKSLLSNSANLMTICTGILNISMNPRLLSAAGKMISCMMN